MLGKEIREFTDSELEEKLNEAKIELFNLRFQHATGQLENPTKIKFVRRDIARLQTVRRERELKIKVSSEESKPKAGSKPLPATD